MGIVTQSPVTEGSPIATSTRLRTGIPAMWKPTAASCLSDPFPIFETRCGGQREGLAVSASAHSRTGCSTTTDAVAYIGSPLPHPRRSNITLERLVNGQQSRDSQQQAWNEHGSQRRDDGNAHQQRRPAIADACDERTEHATDGHDDERHVKRFEARLGVDVVRVRERNPGPEGGA